MFITGLKLKFNYKVCQGVVRIINKPCRLSIVLYTVQKYVKILNPCNDVVQKLSCRCFVNLQCTVYTASCVRRIAEQETDIGRGNPDSKCISQTKIIITKRIHLSQTNKSTNTVSNIKNGIK